MSGALDFLGGRLGAIGMFTGLTSSRDDGRAHAITNTFGDQLSNAQGQWLGQNDLNAQFNNSIAGTDYNALAQQAYQNQLANYQQQGTAAQMLYNQATGQAPSYADLQMQAGLGLANNQIQSAALSQQGGVAPGLSQRNMLNAQAMQNAQITSQGQANRANELNMAQQNYSALLGAMGQTAAGMTGIQNQMGNQAYERARGALDYNTQMNQQRLNNWNNYSTSLLNAQMSDISGRYESQQAQNQAVGNTLSSIASGGASMAGGGATAAKAAK